MIRNFFKIAFRNLFRNKAFTAINIAGLAIGMASAILILLWIQNEVSYDRFHEKKDRLYQAYNRDKFNGALHAWGNTPKIMGPTIKHDYPDAEGVARINNANFLLTLGDKHFNINGNFTDPDFLTMFSFPMVAGNAKTALNADYSIVLTQKTAKQLFGNEDAMGKVIRIDSSDNFTVTGVLKDLPNNTKFKFDYLLPWSYMKKIKWDDEYWGNNSVYTYILLKPNVTEASFTAKIKNITINHTKGADQSTTTVFLHPADKWRLYSKSENGQLIGGRIEIVKLFGIIAAFILLIACINFMNLSTARSEKRAKEVGIRKVVGAQKISLVAQFIGESVLLALFAGIVAIGIVELSLHGFNQLVQKELYIDFGNGYYWLTALLFIIFTGLVAGSYPAFYLSSYKPVKVLKGTFKAANALVTPRKVLVVMQFTFAIVLIICTIIVEHQINYAQQRDAGYVKNNLAYTIMQGDIDKHYDLIKQELLGSGAAVAVAKTSAPMTEHWSDSWGYQWQGSTKEDEKVDFNVYSTEADFVKTMGLKIIQGRDIDIKAYPTDSFAMLVNEAAVKSLRFKDPIGQVIKGNGPDAGWHIVGVIKDFILESPYQPVQPMLIQGPGGWFNVVNFKLNPSNSVANNLAKAEQVFKKYNSQYPFDYKFYDEEYAAKFEDEQRVGTLAGLFAGLTIFISCLGLFGLATYMAENRIKEIGVRKVLGASVANITTLLSTDFLKLVIISFIVASPIAWYAMFKWLQTYPYRISIEWWVFALAGVLSVIIAILSVSYQAIRAAVANPTRSLRTE